MPQTYLINTFALYDLYLERELFGERITVTLGRLSAGQFFATLPAMTMVVSAAVNGNPTSLLPLPGRPRSHEPPGGLIKVKPTEDTYTKAGIFQASPRAGVSAYHGADFSIRSDDGALLIGEMGWTPDYTPARGRSPMVRQRSPGH